ncbi:hypothetical protein NJBCHELONAE_33810 [Mycobacteroides chelonae]|nr:hypothetical protein NJBCHELONAE_33810 [Mycobacteroides chelonae]
MGSQDTARAAEVNTAPEQIGIGEQLPDAGDLFEHAQEAGFVEFSDDSFEWFRDEVYLGAESLVPNVSVFPFVPPGPIDAGEVGGGFGGQAEEIVDYQMRKWLSGMEFLVKI